MAPGWRRRERTDRERPPRGQPRPEVPPAPFAHPALTHPSRARCSGPCPAVPCVCPWLVGGEESATEPLGQLARSHTLVVGQIVATAVLQQEARDLLATRGRKHGPPKRRGAILVAHIRARALGEQFAHPHEVAHEGRAAKLRIEIVGLAWFHPAVISRSHDSSPPVILVPGPGPRRMPGLNPRRVG